MDLVGNSQAYSTCTRSCPEICPVGDSPAGTGLSVPCWRRALHQPRAAAQAMRGQDIAYDECPISASTT
jgi:hypothetical protein